MRIRTKKDNHVERDPAVVAATQHASQLLVQAERLTHRLNVHLDEIQTLIDDRRDRP